MGVVEITDGGGHLPLEVVEQPLIALALQLPAGGIGLPVRDVLYGAAIERFPPPSPERAAAEP
jgi:hypothetical protein